MRFFFLRISIILAFVHFHFSSSYGGDLLDDCWKKQVKLLSKKSIELNYQEVQSKTYHSPQPWQTYNSKSEGRFVLNQANFTQSDLVLRGGRQYISSSQFIEGKYYFQPAGQDSLSTINIKKNNFELANSARYNPAILLSLFINNREGISVETNNDATIYSKSLIYNTIKISVNNKSKLVNHIQVIYQDDLWGDVSITYTYIQYKKAKKLWLPTQVVVEKFHNIFDTVKIVNFRLSKTFRPILEIPENYQIIELVKENFDYQYDKIGDHIHTFEFTESKSRALLVEFSSFFMVIDAPLKSEYGEMIRSKATQIAPNKPIRYYGLTHHHPWAVGGMRPFVAAGATVLTCDENNEYLHFIAENSRSFTPDTQSIRMTVMQAETIDTFQSITDGEYSVEIYRLGLKSNHTTDYMLFYFPEEKILFDADIVWVKANGEVSKASKGQRAIYQLIMDKKLDVNFIYKEWTVGPDSEYKSIISIGELKLSTTQK